LRSLNWLFQTGTGALGCRSRGVSAVKQIASCIAARQAFG